MKKKAEKEGLGIKFEYTSRETPQQNRKVERGFATVNGRARAMMLTAGFNDKKKYELWTEAVSTATLLANKTVTKKLEQSPQERFYKNAKDKQSNLKLKSFGEIGIVTKKLGPNIKGKIDDRGEICLFVGYAKNHVGNVYTMHNLRTKKVWLTQDVQWTKKFYSSQKGKKASKVYLELNTFEKEPE